MYTKKQHYFSLGNKDSVDWRTWDRVPLLHGQHPRQRGQYSLCPGRPASSQGPLLEIPLPSLRLLFLQVGLPEKLKDCLVKFDFRYVMNTLSV